LNDNLPDTVLFTPKIIADDVSTKFFFHLCDSPSKELSSINKVSLV
jgi:phage terminase large subunit